MSRKLRLRQNQVLDLADLDGLLDRPVKTFDRAILRLAKEFRGKRIRLRLPEGAGQLPALDAAVRWTGAYDAQVQGLPRMDRAEEFLMARRYEFLKARARIVLEELGYPRERVERLLLRPRLLLGEGEAPAGRRAAQRAAAVRYLRVCLEELEDLRNLYVQGALYMVLHCANRYRNMGVDYVDLVQEGNASLFQAIEGFDWRRDVRFRTYAHYWIQQAILKQLYNSSRTVRIPIWVQKVLKKIQRARDEDRADNGGEPTSDAIGARLDMPGERVDELLRVRRHAVSLDVEPAGDDRSASTMAQSLPDESLVPVHESIVDGDLGERLHEVMADLPERERMILCRRYGLDGRDAETLSDIARDLGITAERVRQLQKAAITRLQRPPKLRRLRAFAG